MLPALVLAAFSVYHGRFALIDDGALIYTAKIHSVADTFKPAFYGNDGRYHPLLWSYFVILYSMLPVKAWIAFLANALALVGIVFFVQRLASRTGGMLAATVACWLITLNSASVENFYTLGKQEPKQLFLWLPFILLLGWVDADRMVRGFPFMVAAGALLTAGMMLFKQTGFLLLPALLFVSLEVFLHRAKRPAGNALRTLVFCGVTSVPLVLLSLWIAWTGIRRGGYVQEHVLRGGGFGHIYFSGFLKDPHLFALILCAVVAGGISWRVAGNRLNMIYKIIYIELLTSTAFFLQLPDCHPYYLLPVAAFSAIVLAGSIACLAASTRASLAVKGVIAVLLFWGMQQTLCSASALASWNWLYDRLNQTVAEDRPGNVYFYRSGSWETHAIQAPTTWNKLNGGNANIAILDEAPDREPDVPHVSFKDLRRGDWILEEFGTLANAKIPFRDVGIAWPEQYGLIRDGHSFLPVAAIHQFKSTFPAFKRWPVLKKPKPTYLMWRISQVQSDPEVYLEGLTLDYWMEKSAVIWVKSSRKSPVVVRIAAFSPPSIEHTNTLYFSAGDRRLLACPAPLTGVAECVLDPALIATPAGNDGWTAIRMQPEFTYSQLKMGISPDPRDLSFSFIPTSDAGAEGLSRSDRQ